MTGRQDSVLPSGALVGGRYEILRELASGDTGRVYRARDTQEGREVALKILHPELLSDSNLQRRFRREVAVLEALEHPAIVRVFDAGTDARGCAYFAMELLDGETLRSRFDRERTLAAPLLLPIVEAVCGGLGAAHAHGVVHGDLTPGNVVLLPTAQDACAKILDFGFSKILGLERLTATGEVIGTPHYMAPELLTGRTELDGRVDVYALGVILYEALSGELPFRAKNAGKLIFEIVTKRPRPLADVAIGIDEGVARVVEHAMHPDPTARLESAPALADRFRSAVLSARE